MYNQARIVLVHMICGVTFLTFPFLFAKTGSGSGGAINDAILRDFWGYVFCLLFFYLNYFVLVPRLFLKKKYIWYALVVGACFYVTTFHPSFGLNGKSSPPPQEMPKQGHKNIKGKASHQDSKPKLIGGLRHNFTRFSIVFFISILLRMNDRWRKAEEERTEAELSFLKAQINPHFLFNTLNGIYALAVEKADNTADAIARLSGMMRYVTTEAGKDYVSLEKELDYLKNYIELQKMRFGDTLLLEFIFNDNRVEKKIAPLLLEPFIENAFKYGVNPESESNIKINIKVDSEELKMEVFNQKVFTNLSKERTGIGLRNTKERLNLLYPGSHTLEMQETETEFFVKLIIQFL